MIFFSFPCFPVVFFFPCVPFFKAWEGVILVPSHMITLHVHTVSITVYVLAFTFTLYVVPRCRLSKDNRTWSCSVGATTLSVSVKSHDSLTLEFIMTMTPVYKVLL